MATTTTVEALSLREAAAAAHQKRAADNERCRQRRQERLTDNIRAFCQREWGVPPDKVTVTYSDKTAEFHIDDLHFLYRDAPFEAHALLLGTCPECGGPAWSQPIYHIAELGAMLAAFQPSEAHICGMPDLDWETDPNLGQADAPPDDGQALAEALVTFLRNRGVSIHFES